MKTIRNVAIIAHVDHGKTTLVDEMLKAGKLFSGHKKPGELMMDSNDLEKERGITILSKNASVVWNDHKINIIDTPGHSDFGGEVERVLNMADGVLLLVDAFEGPMPQTRFVLQKALALGLKPVVVINKVDKPNCRPEDVQEMVFDLMFSLDANEYQLDFPTIYGSALNGWMSNDLKQQASDISALMDAVIEHIPVPDERKGTPQMLITSLEYSPYVGRIAIGRMHRGTLRTGQEVAVVSRTGEIYKTRIKELNVFDGLGRIKTDVLPNGELGAIIGLDKFDIGESICDPENPEPLDPIAIDDPTMSMLFTINNSPFFGKDGKFVTSRHIKDRLDKELEKNLALRVEETNSADAWNVYGRGVLHLSVLIETMRREGYEMQVGQPRVIIKEIGGEKHEPVEQLTIDLPNEYSGRAIEMVTQKKGELLTMQRRGDRVVLEFNIPSRGIIGLRNNILTATAGEAIMAHRFVEFQPWKGNIPKRYNGSLIVLESGTAFAYALDKLQDRGRFFIFPQEEVYMGQVVGENNRDGDLTVNVTKSKKLTNIRASGTDDKAKLAPPIIFSLEEALEHIQGDEYVEVTPKAIRIRKMKLHEYERKRASKN